MMSENEIKQRMHNIIAQLEITELFPYNSWKRRMLIKEYNILKKVLEE